MQLAATTTALATPPPTKPTNPWGFPDLDPNLARPVIDGLQVGVTIVNRLIDRSFAVRQLLDRDLKATAFGQDTVRAVELLTRARDYAIGTLDDTHLSHARLEPIHDWARNSRDDRVRVVGEQAFAIQSAVRNLLDDEEGNVRETIAEMRSSPDARVWQSIRDGVDGAIANLYGSRDVYDALHVLRAAAGLRS
ncbi:MAG: hypothetical protein JWL76_315 [Thermoleophilia bacterium]|nr:hypothetical protein [Thermoleophilia bacterium]